MPVFLGGTLQVSLKDRTYMQHDSFFDLGGSRQESKKDNQDESSDMVQHASFEENSPDAPLLDVGESPKTSAEFTRVVSDRSQGVLSDEEIGLQGKLDMSGVLEGSKTASYTSASDMDSSFAQE
ncbi:unnamed protein product, partial [Heterosigma akashiwo]